MARRLHRHLRPHGARADGSGAGARGDRGRAALGDGPGDRAAGATRRFVAGKWMVDKLRAHGVRASVYLPFGVERSRFTPARTRRVACGARSSGQAARRRALLVGVGRFAIEKRWDVVLDAFARFAPKATTRCSSSTATGPSARRCRPASRERDDVALPGVRARPRDARRGAGERRRARARLPVRDVRVRRRRGDERRAPRGRPRRGRRRGARRRRERRALPRRETPTRAPRAIARLLERVERDGVAHPRERGRARRRAFPPCTSSSNGRTRPTAISSPGGDRRLPDGPDRRPTSPDRRHSVGRVPCGVLFATPHARPRLDSRRLARLGGRGRAGARARPRRAGRSRRCSSSPTSTGALPLDGAPDASAPGSASSKPPGTRSTSTASFTRAADAPGTAADGTAARAQVGSSRRRSSPAARPSSATSRGTRPSSASIAAKQVLQRRGAARSTASSRPRGRCRAGSCRSSRSAATASPRTTSRPRSGDGRARARASSSTTRAARPAACSRASPTAASPRPLRAVLPARARDSPRRHALRAPPPRSARSARVGGARRRRARRPAPGVISA